MSTCENCGANSHCGVPLYSEQHFNLKDELAPRIKLCSTCRCEKCNSKICFICKQEKYGCKFVDYRDHKNELKGRISVCPECWESDK